MKKFTLTPFLAVLLCSYSTVQADEIELDYPKFDFNETYKERYEKVFTSDDLGAKAKMKELNENLSPDDKKKYGRYTTTQSFYLTPEFITDNRPNSAYDRGLSPSTIGFGINTAAAGKGSIAIGLDTVALSETNKDKLLNLVKRQYQFNYINYEIISLEHDIERSKSSPYYTLTSEQLAEKQAKIKAYEKKAEEIKAEMPSMLSELGENMIAIGTDAEAHGDRSIAMGKSSYTLGENSVAYGTENKVYTTNSGAVGHHNTVGDKDNPTTTEKGTFVLGSNVTTTANNAVVLGANSTGVNDAVSVGSQNNLRKIVNVKEGEVSSNSHEAVTGSQLYTVHETLNGKASKNAENLDNDNVEAWRRKLRIETITLTDNQIRSAIGNKLDQKANADASNIDPFVWRDKLGINEMEKKIHAGIASAMAMAGLPQVHGKKFTVGVGVGSYKGQQSLAMGMYGRLSEKATVKVSFSMDSQKSVGFNAGLGIGFD